MSLSNLSGIRVYLSHNIFVLTCKFDNITIFRGILLVLVPSGYMYYSLIVSFPSLHVHVLGLKPFQVGLGHIGLIGHHGAKLVWPFALFILFQALKH
jgi:hypothetical protein